MFSAPNDAKGGKNSRRPRNPFQRMHVPHSAAHVVATENPDGSITFSQFSLGEGAYANVKTAVLQTPPRPKEKHRSKTKDKKRKSVSGDSTDATAATAPSSPMSLESTRASFPLLVSSPNGTALKSSRSVDIVVKDPSIEGGTQKSILFFFSPERRKEGGKIHAPKKTEKLEDVVSQEISELDEDSESPTESEQSETESPSKRRRLRTKLDDLLAEFAVEDKENLPVNVNQKGGEPVRLSYYFRFRKNTKSQSCVMGKTAKEELLSHLDTDKHKFEPQKYNLLRNLVDNFAIEWLHRLAFSLCPKSVEPQSPVNLAAGPKWINTYMMVLEGLAERFLKKHPEIEAIANPIFILLPDSDVIDVIRYEVILKKDCRKVSISSSIKALELPSAQNWPSSTDLPQINCVIESLLNDSPPSFTKKLLVV